MTGEALPVGGMAAARSLAAPSTPEPPVIPPELEDEEPWPPVDLGAGDA